MKLIITGHATHGKDTVSSMFRDLGLKFTVSSSFFVAERCVRPYLEEQGLIYPTLEACYADRVNHRDKWYNAIHTYNTPDNARMGRELFMEQDIYCGLRHQKELRAMQAENIYDVAIWVDRSKILKPEPETSMTIEPTDCDYILDNNGTLLNTSGRVGRLFDALRHHV